MADCLYIAGHDGAGHGKVWCYLAGATSAIDISTALVEASAEICSLAWDSANLILYAGTVDGKILRYDGSWSLEFDTADAFSRAIMGIANYGGLWIAIQSGRPGLDAASGILSWWQSAPGMWSTVGTTPPPQARACGVLVTAGAEGTFAICGTNSTAKYYYSTDGKIWIERTTLSQGGDTLCIFPNFIVGGVDNYWTELSGGSNIWYRQTMLVGAWNPGGTAGSGATYGSHAKTNVPGSIDRDALKVDYTYHRIYSYQAGGGGAGWRQEADLPGGGALHVRSAFAELGGTLYVVVEYTNPVLYHRVGNNPGSWSADINAGSGAFLDAIQGETFGVVLIDPLFDNFGHDDLLEVMKVMDNL